MATRRVAGKETSQEPVRKQRPATTPEARENQLIALAVNLTEKQLREGTASSQVITHYLKLGSSREALEQARIAGEVELNKAKIETMAQAGRIEELMGEALSAMRAYKGESSPEDDRDYD